MKIIIGNTIFNDATWSKSDLNGDWELILNNNYTIAEIANICSVATDIEVYNTNDELIGKWYVLEFVSITKEEDRIVVNFKVSTISQAKEDELTQTVATAENILLEVAGMVAEIGDSQSSVEEHIKQYKEQVDNTLKSFDNQTNHNDERFNETNGLMMNIQAEIADVRNGLGVLEAKIATMPENVNERFHALENQYNALADRVAMLENRGN